jgi:hypothetical protein
MKPFQTISVIAAIIFGLSVSSLLAEESVPPLVELAKDGKALVAVTIGPHASDAVKASAADLAKYLGQITGGSFTVEVGDGARGLVLGLPIDFDNLPFEVTFGAGPFHREGYLLRTHGESVYMLGAADLAVSHAVWDLLHRFGYRQFFPGETWEVVPNSPSLKIAVDTTESPSFYARRIWYNWGLWGYNEVPYRQWCQRNRAVQGFALHSSHAYESILSARRAEFEKHPEYLALVNGVRRREGGDVKFCISNPGLRKLVQDYAVEVVKASPLLDSISMDPSDGDNWCECAECARMGSVSDRVVTLANDVAVAINQLGLGEKHVGMYAYNQHSAPPKVRVNRHVIPSATTSFIGGGFTFDQVVDGWQRQGATLGCYDYLSVVDWDWNLPRCGAGSRPARLITFLPKLHQQGIRFYDAESGDCWGPCGLGYYFASRALWDVEQAEQFDAIFDDFLTRAFETAKEPMREFYRLINLDTQRRSAADMVGRMYRQLDAARKATQNPNVLARIDDLILYTRYTELYYAYAAGAISVDDVARHAYRMRKTMMVHSYGLWCRLVSQQAALAPEHPLKDESPLTAEDLIKFLTEGIARNQPENPGFASLDFSRNLVPATPLKLSSGAPGNFPNDAQEQQHYYVWLPEGTGALKLQINVQKVWATRTPKISLFSPQEVLLGPVASDDSYRADGKTYEIALRTPHAGLHKLETIDGGDFTRITWPTGVAVTVESGIDTPTVTSHFRSAWSLYFYVPKGTKEVAGWASRIANWAPRVAGKLLDSDGNVQLDFAKLEEGWFKVAVPTGQDGKLWKFESSQGQRLLMTVPPFLARTADELLLPEEVVKADAVK